MGASGDTGLGAGLRGVESAGVCKGCTWRVSPGSAGEEPGLCVCAKVVCSLHLTYNVSI